ncbi:MAG: HEAT repeat domain-containing protein, partial [bacterium]|nr:HEAT repeat domain-containing protein [bacterium]
EVEELRKIALGEIPGIYRGQRVKAISVLALSGKQEYYEILSKMISNDEEEADIRASAAINLSLVPAEYAEPKLIANAGIKDDLVLVNIIKSLGRIGGEKALKALDRISDAKTGYVLKQLRFAKALVSYRLGLDRKDLSFIEGVQRRVSRKDEPDKFTMALSGSEELKGPLSRLEGIPYGIDIAADFGFKFTCGTDKWVLFIDKKVPKERLLSLINERNMLLGLFARCFKETDTYSVRYLLLTRPRGSIFEFMFVRTDGEICYSGRGRVEHGKLAFAVYDVDRPGTAPTKVIGEIGPDGVELKRYLFRRRKEKRKTKKLTPEVLKKTNS